MLHLNFAFKEPRFLDRKFNLEEFFQVEFGSFKKENKNGDLEN